jgi:hypothetical protein
MKLPVQILKKLNDYYVTCKSRYYKHLKVAELYRNLYMNTTMPIIVLSSMTTVLASYNGSVVDYRLAIAVAVFSGLTTIGQALVSFYEFNSKYESHLSISNKFINLSRMIETEIYINYYNTSKVDVEEYIKYLFEKINKEFTTIQESELPLPNYINSKHFVGVRCGSNDINDVLIDIDHELPLSGINSEIDSIVDRSDLSVKSDPGTRSRHLMD